MTEYVNAIARLWWGWSAAMFWQVGLVIVLIACIDRLIRRWAWPHLRYALWSLILIKLILPPTLSLPSGALPQLAPVAGQAVRWVDSETPVAEQSPVLESFYQHSAVAEAMEPTLRIPVAFATIESHEALTETNPAGKAPAFQRRRPQPVRQVQGSASLEAATPLSTNPRLSWQVYAMATWFAGTLTLGIWLFLRLHSLAGPQGNRVVPTDGTTLPQSFYSQMAGCAERLGLRRLPRVIVVRRLATPAVFGVFRPVLLMPKGYLSKLSRRDTEHMLLHELAHIQRGDLRTHGLYMLLQVLYWYNPLLWLVRRQLHHLRELSCDATVAELLRERTKAYRQTLLETARRFLATSTEPGLGLLGLFEDANRLATRLNWLARPTWRYKTMKRAFVWIVAAAMFACVLPMAQGQDHTPAVVEHQPSHNTQDEAPNTQQLDELQAKLQELEIERTKLQKELQALAQARQKTKEAQTHSIEAAKDAEKAKKEAIKAHLKAQKAQGHAVEAHGNTQDHQQWAEEMQAWAEQVQQWQQGPEMQAWQKNVEQWKDSEDFQKWQEAMEKWGSEYGHRIEKAYGGDAGTDGVVAIPPMPPMPAMPAMPAPPAQPAPHPIPHPVPQVHMPAVPDIHMPDMPHVNAHGQHDDGKAKAIETMRFTSPLVDGGLLVVKNRVGAVNVRGSETNECRVDVKVTARAETEEEARAMAEAVKMKMDTSDRRFSIEPVKPDNEDWSGLDVTFEIAVPRQTNLEITADVGAVQLRDVQGQIEVKANVGGIKTDNVRGDVKLETNVGDVDFVAPDDLSAEITATTNIGSIKTNLPIQIRSSGEPGPGGVNMSMGKIAVGTLGAGAGKVNLKSNVGTISIRSKTSVGEPARVGTMSLSHASSTVAHTADVSDVRMIESIKEMQEGDRYTITRTDSQTVSLRPGSALDVTNGNGAVTLRGTDGKDCRVQAVLAFGAPTLDAARQLSKAVWVDVTPTGKGLAIAPTMPEKMPAGHSCRVDLVIEVPRRTDPNIANEGGDVQVANIEGQIKLLVEDGNVACEHLAGDLDACLEDGELKIDRCAFSKCRVVMEDGSVRCDDLTGNLEFTLEDGQIDIVYGDQVPEACTIQAITEDGSIRLSAPAAMFLTDDSAKVRTTEEGAEWKTVVATAQGARAVTLRAGDGSVKVDRR